MAQSIPMPEYFTKGETAARRGRVQLILIGLLVGIAYYLGAELAFMLRVPSTRSSILWVPNAVLLAALLLTPTRTWWVWVLAAVPAHLAAQSRDAGSVVLLLYPFLANVAQAIVAATGLRCFGLTPPRFDTLRDMTLFVLIAVIAAPGLISFLAGWLFVSVGWETDFWLVSRGRFLNNIITGLTMAPLILIAAAGGLAALRRLKVQRYLEFALLAIGLVGTLYLTHSWTTAEAGSVPVQLYAPLPFLLWAAVRFGAAGLSISLLAVAAYSISETINGRGPYVALSPGENVLAMQLSLAVLALPLMFGAALLEERRKRENALRQSEERYRAVVEHQTELVCRFLPDATLSFVNPAYARYFGKSPDELIGQSFLSLIPEEDRQAALEHIQSLSKKPSIGSWEHRVFSNQTELRWQHWVDRPILDDSGRVVEFQRVGRDITERKRAEQALRESEERLARTERFSIVMVTHTDLEGRWLKVPPTLCELLGYTEQELVGRPFRELTHPDDIDLNLHQRVRLLRGEIKSFDLEKRYIRKDGGIVWVYINVSVVMDANGIPVHCISYIRDISKRKRAEAALRESEERLQLALEAGRMGVWDWDRRTNVLEWSSEHFTIMGLAPFSVTPTYQTWLERVHPDDLPLVSAVVERAIAERVHYRCEYRIVLADGTNRWVVSRGQPVYNKAGECVRVMGVIVDTTERKQAEDALRESEERNRAILESALDSIVTIDHRGKIKEFNPAAEKTFGYKRTEAIGKQMADLIVPHAARDKHYRGLAHYLATGEGPILDNRMEMTAMRADGTEIPIELAVTRIGVGGAPMFTGYIRDITQRKRAEEEIHRLKERLEAENVYLRAEVSGTHRFGELIGQSEAIGKVLKQAGQVAVTDMAVLILGETGTGKELIARAIHERSARKQRPLVKVNCSTLPAELMESELFGHEKGAFTGAVTRQVGRFELADAGTIFLDEIGDLPLSLQAKLLRVLQEGEFERLGSSKTIRVNVRVIAATNRDLSKAMREEAFRADLYYRLAVYPIQMPPLRERKEDIGLLAKAFLREASRRLGRSFGAIPGQVVESLQRYDWPGNVRELQNVIERAAVTSTGRELQLPEGWQSISLGSYSAVRTSVSSGASDHPSSPHEATLEEFERKHIVQVLEQTKWRIEGRKGAAVILGLNPSTLRSRMQKLGIVREVKPATSDRMH